MLLKKYFIINQNRKSHLSYMSKLLSHQKGIYISNRSIIKKRQSKFKFLTPPFEYYFKKIHLNLEFADLLSSW
jgi:hypothetical protein